MKKCLIYGNCQAGIVYKVFLKTDLVKFYDITYLLCHNHKTNNIDTINISQFDLIITMPIYEHIFAKSTSSMLRKKRDDCIVIIFPSLYFDFYFPNWTFLKTQTGENSEQLDEPSVFHDQNLISLYQTYGSNKNILIKKYKNIIMSPNFYDNNIYIEKYNKSINNLKDRFLKAYNLYKIFEPIYFIDIINGIKNNYNKDLLFYSHLHPTYEHLLKMICKKILSIIKKEEIELPKTLPLDESGVDRGYIFKLPLYCSISSVIDFDAKNYILPVIRGKETTIEEYIKKILLIYDKKYNQKYFNFNSDQ